MQSLQGLSRIPHADRATPYLDKNHAFWRTIIYGEDGEEKENRTDSGEFAWGFINHKKDFPYDHDYAYQSQIHSEGPSTEMCDAVDHVRASADAWPDWTYPYFPSGPNSNTVASSILWGSALPQGVWAPPDTSQFPGWTWFKGQ
jgi:hypothetical protein